MHCIHWISQAAPEKTPEPVPVQPVKAPNPKSPLSLFDDDAEEEGDLFAGVMPSSAKQKTTQKTVHVKFIYRYILVLSE